MFVIIAVNYNAVKGEETNVPFCNWCFIVNGYFIYSLIKGRAYVRVLFDDVSSSNIVFDAKVRSFYWL